MSDVRYSQCRLLSTSMVSMKVSRVIMVVRTPTFERSQADVLDDIFLVGISDVILPSQILHSRQQRSYRARLISNLVLHRDEA